MGHKMVSILDGGLPKWKEAGGETENGPFREPTVSKIMQPQLIHVEVASFPSL